MIFGRHKGLGDVKMAVTAINEEYSVAASSNGLSAID
jgi:hypothetical protein